jgi:hypothetical protein
MAVTLEHDGERIIAVTPHMARWPWSNCPGAKAVLEQTFLAKSIHASDTGGSKKLNCTHLYDLAELATRHAFDAGQTDYDISVSDPVEGQNRAELRKNGELQLAFDLINDVVQAPEAAKGIHLLKLRDWTTTLQGDERECARILQWVSLIAHSRQMAWPIGDLPDPQMGASCFNYQPGTRETSRRVGPPHDFSRGGREPLSSFDGRAFRA